MARMHEKLLRNIGLGSKKSSSAAFAEVGRDMFVAVWNKLGPGRAWVVPERTETSSPGLDFRRGEIPPCCATTLGTSA